MNVEPFEFRGTGGARLHAVCWSPATGSHSAVVLAHGLAEHGGRYGALVERLVARGHRVYAPDHRGHGRSEGARAYVERFDWLVEDLDRVFVRARAAHAAPATLIGHSMGGAVAFAYALRHPANVARLVLSAPLLATDPSPPRVRLAAARLLSRVAPRVGALKLPADTVSRDPAVVRAYEGDPLVYRGAISARTLVELVDATSRFAAGAAGLRTRVLILHGTGDALVPLRHCAPVYERIDPRLRTLRTYDGLYHELFNEPERAAIYAEVEAWLAANP